MSATISAVDCELEARFPLSSGSDCESDMVDAFTSHSSGSDRRSEVRWLEIRTRRDLPYFGSQRVEHQVAGGTEHAADVCDLKTIALHLQVSNHCDGRVSQLSATIRDDLERHFVFCFCCFNNVSTKTG
jgi:hypothetical protein